VLKHLKRHHIGVIALLVALLGGTAYAATQRTSRTLHPTAHRAWRDPAIAKAIAASGQKIVAQRITIVGANKPWIDTGLSAPPGAHLWIDTRSDGRWSGNPQLFPYSDARGLPVYPGQYRVDAKAAVLSLIGFVGPSPPTPSEVLVRRGAHSGGKGGITDPGFIEIGNTLKNFTPATSGEIWLRNNDNTNYYSDSGRQFVKTILTANAP
jgi:hypothetical protein